MTKHQTEPKNTEKKQKKQEELDVCQKAPEFAEHHRLEDDDMPCADGRGGKGAGVEQSGTGGSK